MGNTKKLPIGIENFKEIRTEGFYYVDKTGLITELLNNWGKVNLFTRPRRFGKSLNMSMLKHFFEFGCDSKIFEGLKIAEEKELCEKYMGKFPVIFITLKGVGSETYQTARDRLCAVIGREALRFQFLLESDILSRIEKERYQQLIQIGGAGGPEFIMSDSVLENSLLMLSELLNRHYGKKVILLIDEYDVPLDKARQFQYYDEMLNRIRNLFSQALKSNDSIYFAVMTGCLRIAKESIFTGLNNLKILSITDVRYDDQFGFSDQEVRKLLEYYGLDEKYKLMKEWYDGYRFGKADVYCPWDVINYCDCLCAEPDAVPRAFWLHTSGNEIIQNFLKMARQKTRGEIERLAEGESVAKKIDQELTYRDLYQNIEHVWSVLFMTGYLTQRGRREGEIYDLAIPNREIREIFVQQIQEWFQHEARKDVPKLDAFCEAFLNGDVNVIEEQFNAFLQKTISIRDTSVKKEKKENYYHGILLGLLSHRGDWDIHSNTESGEGYGDILLELEEKSIGVVIEVKYPDGEKLETSCQKALEQIEKKGYDTRLKEDGIRFIFKYGIACQKKRCKVQMIKNSD